MKNRVWIFVLAFTVPGFAFGEDPKPYSLERYSVIWQNSKFAKKSDGKARPLDHGGWILGGVFHLDGKDTAVIINEATGAVEEVRQTAKSPSGLTLRQVIRATNGTPIRVQVKDEVRTFWIARTRMKVTPPTQLTSAAEAQDEKKKVVSK